jgi:hypothetical protein
VANGNHKCQRWLDLNRRKKKAWRIIPPNAKLIGSNRSSFPAYPTMRIAKLEKNNISNASESTRTTHPHNGAARQGEHNTIGSMPQQPAAGRSTGDSQTCCGSARPGLSSGHRASDGLDVRGLLLPQRGRIGRRRNDLRNLCGIADDSRTGRNIANRVPALKGAVAHAGKPGVARRVVAEQDFVGTVAGGGRCCSWAQEGTYYEQGFS